MDVMKPVRVGLKYCGGCNERYDRMGTYRGIVSQCSEHTQFVAAAGREQEEFDLVMVLCGCQAQCPNTSKLKSKHGFISLFQDVKAEDVIAKIHAVEKLNGYRD